MADSSQPGSSTYAEKDEYSKYKPLYKAALRGDWESAETFFFQDARGLTARINKLRETALHVSVGVGSPKSINFAKNLMNRMPVQALELRDEWNATALHTAAWIGNLEAAKALVERHHSLIYMRDCRNWLPFHLAAMSSHKDTLSYLVDQTSKFDPVSKLFVNEDSGACFLISVILSDFYDVALDFVKRYPTLATSKQDNDDCALKAIARKVSAFPSSCQHNFWQRIIYAHVPVKLDDCIIYHNEGDIENPVDNSQVIVQKYNWARVLMQHLSISVPCIKTIHEQKKMHIQALELVKCLCTPIRLNDANAYELLAKEALHTAAREGIHEVIEEIVESFPCLVWARDSEGHNLFQRAVIERHEKVFNLLYQMRKHKQTIIQSRDNSGNNLLHLAGRVPPPNRLNLVSGAALQMQRELQWFEQLKTFANPNDIQWQNADHETPTVVFTKEHKNLVVEGEKWMKGTANSCTIPAMLIATVVFAAAITVPGGNNNADGLPIFSKELAFNIFVVFDAISLFTSTTSLLMFLSILTSHYTERDFLFVLPNRLIIGLFTLFLSITTMVVAFSSALYLVIVFDHNDPWIIIPVVALACLPIITFASLHIPLVLDMIVSTYGRGIFGKQSDRPFY